MVLCIRPLSFYQPFFSLPRTLGRTSFTICVPTSIACTRTRFVDPHSITLLPHWTILLPQSINHSPASLVTLLGVWSAHRHRGTFLCTAMFLGTMVCAANYLKKYWITSILFVLSHVENKAMDIGCICLWYETERKVLYLPLVITCFFTKSFFILVILLHVNCL